MSTDFCHNPSYAKSLLPRRGKRLLSLWLSFSLRYMCHSGQRSKSVLGVPLRVLLRLRSK